MLGETLGPEPSHIACYAHTKLSQKYADQNDQIDIESCDCHVITMAAEQGTFKKSDRLMISAGL